LIRSFRISVGILDRSTYGDTNSNAVGTALDPRIGHWWRTGPAVIRHHSLQGPAEPTRSIRKRLVV
jgi:hypothetical protein